MLERRALERKEFTKEVDFKASTFESATIFGRGKTLDISSNGLGLLTDRRLETGIVLRLLLPEYWAGTKVPVFAEVAWTQPIPAGIRAGLRFI